MKQVLLVFLGGGLGSILRYLISKPLNSVVGNFYLGTLTVNIIGCLLIGFIIGLSARNNLLSYNSTLFLATGICGGFTTFSAFALEKHTLIKSEEFLPLLLYAGASILLGILAVALGLWFSKFTN
ncbi:fluoride efflux transporter CrcB [Flagellimonas allohymeniacidonis]|uniref:Fluoride-specific ion channel FluC n=1 Tax=Flagellimonas allohymeniacidonis TaxID=2517819 RepID=A0A4Q8QFX9_9FLAO|nr:fluoride efflux transporter CrcB [Allomuricauda hymeniacidonis]TAI49452.1 fluoride efflux transporter CrcB [Allomuricauda hymeniacidonis]